MAMTEASLDRGLTRDLYTSLGEPVSDTAWAVRLHHKPFVNWIWIGCLLMGLGGMLAVFDRRYRARRVAAPMTSPGSAPSGPAASPRSPALAREGAVQ
jgi:cytochrome c-type biogenesis protein CcmF